MSNFMEIWNQTLARPLDHYYYSNLLHMSSYDQNNYFGIQILLTSILLLGFIFFRIVSSGERKHRWKALFYYLSPKQWVFNGNLRTLAILLIVGFLYLQTVWSSLMISYQYWDVVKKEHPWNYLYNTVLVSNGNLDRIRQIRAAVKGYTGTNSSLDISSSLNSQEFPAYYQDMKSKLQVEKMDGLLPMSQCMDCRNIYRPLMNANREGSKDPLYNPISSDNTTVLTDPPFITYVHLFDRSVPPIFFPEESVWSRYVLTRYFESFTDMAFPTLFYISMASFRPLILLLLPNSSSIAALSVMSSVLSPGLVTTLYALGTGRVLLWSVLTLLKHDMFSTFDDYSSQEEGVLDWILPYDPLSKQLQELKDMKTEKLEAIKKQDPKLYEKLNELKENLRENGLYLNRRLFLSPWMTDFALSIFYIAELLLLVVFILVIYNRLIKLLPKSEWSKSARAKALREYAAFMDHPELIMDSLFISKSARKHVHIESSSSSSLTSTFSDTSEKKTLVPLLVCSKPKLISYYLYIMKYMAVTLMLYGATKFLLCGSSLVLIHGSLLTRIPLLYDALGALRVLTQYVSIFLLIMFLLPPLSTGLLARLIKHVESVESVDGVFSLTMESLGYDKYLEYRQEKKEKKEKKESSPESVFSSDFASTAEPSEVAVHKHYEAPTDEYPDWVKRGLDSFNPQTVPAGSQRMATVRPIPAAMTPALESKHLMKRQRVFDPLEPAKSSSSSSSGAGAKNRSAFYQMPIQGFQEEELEGDLYKLGNLPLQSTATTPLSVSTCSDNV